MWRIPPCLVPERQQMTIRRSRPRYGGCGHARCWTDAAALLEDDAGTVPAAALQRTALLTERCLYTGQGWTEAEDALRTAEAVARSDDERGAAASERGHLAYASTLLAVRDRADEASVALSRSAALLARVARPAAAGLPARADRPEHRGVAAGRARRLPPGARRCGEPGRRVAAVVHLAASGRARAARGGAGRGPARLRGVAADPGGAGVPGRYGAGADLARGGGGRTGGGPAARRGRPAVPAPRAACPPGWPRIWVPRPSAPPRRAERGGG